MGLCTVQTQPCPRCGSLIHAGHLPHHQCTPSLGTEGYRPASHTPSLTHQEPSGSCWQLHDLQINLNSPQAPPGGSGGSQRQGRKSLGMFFHH